MGSQRKNDADVQKLNFVDENQEIQKSNYCMKFIETTEGNSGSENGSVHLYFDSFNVNFSTD